MGMSRNPASVLFDSIGNPVGIVQDGTIYRLQVQSTLTDSDGTLAAEIEKLGNREALAISYPELMASMYRIEQALGMMNKHLSAITGEEDPL